MCKVYDLKTFKITGDRNKALLYDTDKMQLQETVVHEDPFKQFDHWIACIRNRLGTETGGVYTEPFYGPKLFDTYGEGCTHNSVFQYIPKSNERWNRPFPFPSDVRKIYEVLKASPNKIMKVGYKSDPFMWLDHKYGITKQVIAWANEFKVSLHFETMSDLCAHDDYISLLKAGNHTIVMNMSLNNGDDELERKLSPGAPSLARRHKAIQKLRTMGIRVEIRELSEIAVNLEIQRRTGIAKGCVIKSNGQIENEKCEIIIDAMSR